ncbi:MAG: hypothetical protein CMB51_03375 [Euryarchaeota archaeon]|nr:hypothetical protein [Euryarchaeota archaeon]
MASIVSWLVGGLVFAIIGVPLVRWFWFRYDKPTPEMLEAQRQQKEMHAETKVWMKMEAKLAQEQAKRDEIQEMRRRKAMEAARAKPLDDDSAAMAWQALGMSSTISIEASQTIESVIESTPEDLEPGKNHDTPNARIDTAENSTLDDFQKKIEKHEISGEEVTKDCISEESENNSIEIPAMIDLPPTGNEEEIDPTSYDSDPFADWSDA